jgi:aspartate ammonia-lyase
MNKKESLTMTMRKETDALGIKKIPQSAYYGIHALRAKENFCVTAEKIDSELINGLAIIRKTGQKAPGLYSPAMCDRFVSLCY